MRTNLGSFQYLFDLRDLETCWKFAGAAQWRSCRMSFPMRIVNPSNPILNHSKPRKRRESRECHEGLLRKIYQIWRENSTVKLNRWKLCNPKSRFDWWWPSIKSWFWIMQKILVLCLFKCMHIMHHYTLIHFITSTDGMLIVNNKAPKNKYAEDTV